MFEIQVTTPKNPLKCHNLLTDVKNGKTELTPKFALEFMQSTDNPKNIADFLTILETHLQAHHEKVQDYQKVLLGIEARENQPEATKNKARTLHSKEIEMSVEQYVFTYKNVDFKNISKLTFGRNVDDILCEQCDLSKTEFDITQTGLLTKAIFINCKMPSKLDLTTSKIWSLSFDEIDMTSFNPVYPKEVQRLSHSFLDETMCPAVIDLSEIEKVDRLEFLNCNLHCVKEIKFPQSLKTIYLSNSLLPTWLDIEKLRKDYTVVVADCQIAPKQRSNYWAENIASSLTDCKNNLWQRLKTKITKGR